MCFLRVESLFPLVLWKSYNPLLLVYKVRFPGIPSSFARSHAGKCDLGLRTFTTVGELLWCYCSPVWRSPTRWVWHLIWSWLSLYRPAAASCLWTWGIIYGGFPCPLVDGYSTASCNLMLSQGKMSSHPSPPSWTGVIIWHFLTSRNWFGSLLDVLFPS